MALRRLAAEFGKRYGASLDGRLQGDLCHNFARAFASAKEGMKFSESHEWALADGKSATVGISDHAQAQLGDIVYVELPEVGSSVSKGEPFGVVESVKAASDVFSPVSGKVVECNSVLTENPGMVNKAPEEDGWLMKVELSNPAEMDGLLDSKAYEALNQD